MPSGELRLILLECMATVGQVGNEDYENISLGKAGKTRWSGRRSRVRFLSLGLSVANQSYMIQEL